MTDTIAVGIENCNIWCDGPRKQKKAKTKTKTKDKSECVCTLTHRQNLAQNIVSSSTRHGAPLGHVHDKNLPKGDLKILF